MSAIAGSARPLDGITVVDLTRLLPGPYCTRLLADLGASVLKIEDPHGGDPTRAMPPFENGVGVYFRLLNHGKRSVALDLRAPMARGALEALLARADICVEGFKPDTARELGVDGESIAARLPHLVHCSITGYGQQGAYAIRAGHDVNYQALAGLLGLAPPPQVPPLLVADITGALHAAIAIVAALVGRRRTGRGASLDIALHDAAASWLPFASPMSAAHVPAGELPLSGQYACYNVYETADRRWVALGALEAKFWTRFCEHIGRRDWIWLQLAGEPVRSQLLAEVRAMMRTRTRDEWLSAFAGVDCCFTTVLTPSEAAADPQLDSRGVFDHGGRDDVPRLGAHTEAALRTAGVPEGDIAFLISSLS